MEILIKVSQFILSLSLIIVLHEFGHYWPAKYFKIKVEKFYLFFDVNFSLFKKKIGETEWGIGWLPLGGYVKIAGMIDESMDRLEIPLMLAEEIAAEVDAPVAMVEIHPTHERLEVGVVWLNDVRP